MATELVFRFAGGLVVSAFAVIGAAAVTLIEDDEGKEAAKANARGAAIGSIGLAAFGTVIWVLASRTKAWLFLTDATVVWLAVSVGLWMSLQLVTSVVSRESLSVSTSSKPDRR